MIQAHVLIIRRSKLHYTASGILSQSVHETVTYRCDGTRGCVTQFWRPDKHMCSKLVEAWNKLTEKQKFCASSWLITEIKNRSSRLYLINSGFMKHERADSLYTQKKLPFLFQNNVIRIGFIDIWRRKIQNAPTQSPST